MPDAAPTPDAAVTPDAGPVPHDAAPGPDAFGCGAGRTLCGEGCFDLQTDHDHCGTCDTRCHPGMGPMSETCSLGHCVRD
jgi:hypothetical protein